ncbi:MULTISPECIES: thioredoxin family protein [Sphingobacterium]|uniref:thioredoxin family protein n=1 Tax=Sphingobacterium TaxID=28453 RepID=UPI0013DB0956|nr:MULTISPECIES: thioredoxin family protein [unclassified Sphingobacterium]
MKFETYLIYFEQVLANPSAYPTYTDPEYFNYTKLNWSRTNRWLKRFKAEEETKAFFGGVSEKQTWVLITEPWCGDAAHSVPQIYELVKDNPNIVLDIQLRDAEPFLIDQYLTDGGKSIPKLIIRNESGVDIATWGPRPAVLQELFVKMKEEERPFEEIKEYFQKWYNEDKGIELQKELIELLTVQA